MILSIWRKAKVSTWLLFLCGALLLESGKVNEEQAKAYGNFLGKRYGNRRNIIWLNGGDILGDTRPEVWEALAETIKAQAPDQLMTFSILLAERSHLDGSMIAAGWILICSNQVTVVMDKRGKDGDNHFGPDNWRYVEIDYNLEPTKPTIDGEPSYELIPQGIT